MLRIATRGSGQALRQSQIVAQQLAATGHRTELVVISTYGDRTQADNVPLHSIGGQGVFVKEVQQAVLDGRADLAVHSAKDLPSAEMVGLTIAAFTARRSPADALIGRRLAELAPDMTVATGSVRRRAQLLAACPQLSFSELRGNIETRLTKIPTGGAIVMAVAALEVLGFTERIDEVLDPTVFVPAVGQGCVAVECRPDDDRAASALASVDDASTRWAVTVERAFLAELGTGCSLPVGAYASGRTLHTYLHDASTGRTVRDVLDLTGSLSDDVDIARRAGRQAVVGVAGG